MWQKAKNIHHLLVAVAANTIYRFPSRKLIVIGITGTDGKTTTSSLVYHILKTARKKVSLISTINAIINGKVFDTGFHVTNPASLPLQKFIKQATDSSQKREKEYLVLEVTSHGIDQNRIWGIPFAIAGITNISHEHLDYHKTYNNYVKTKARLLKKADVAVVNKDDTSFPILNNILQEKKHVITYGFKNAQVTPNTFSFKSKLPGIYNIYNCLLAYTICSQLGISDKDIKKGIVSFTLPKGRTEIVYDKNFTVMIDFAHTPNAFVQLLSAIKPKNGKLIHVFGSAGLRDRTKRAKMGEAAARYDDIIILTAEDPRGEKVAEINKQIRQGIISSKKQEIIEIPDRQAAIMRAISLAKKGDMVVITGKAHEHSMNLGNGEEKWDEFTAVKTALNKRIIQQTNNPI